MLQSADIRIADATRSTREHVASAPPAAVELPTPGRSACAGPMTVKVITQRADLVRYAGAWDKLVAAGEHPTPFATWAWFDAWLDAVSPDGRVLVILVLGPDGELVAAAPFAPLNLRLLRLVPYRCLRFLGDLDSGGEYPQILARPEAAAAALPLIAQALAARSDWDCIWLPNVAGWTGAAESFRQLAQLADLHRIERPVEFAGRMLPDSVEAFEGSLSDNLRSTLRRQRRKLEQVGRVELAVCERTADIAQFLPELFRLHAQRRGRLGDTGCFARLPRMRGFYERFAPAALERNWLRLFAMKVDGVVRAVQYGYVYNGVFYQLQEGFDPDAPAGAGNVLRAHVIADCIRNGVREYDFLGEFTEHKRRWGAERRAGCELFLGRRTLKNRLLFARPVWPTGRYLRRVGAPPATVEPPE